MRIKPLVVLSLVCSLSQAADTVASLGDSIKATQFVTAVDHSNITDGTGKVYFVDGVAYEDIVTATTIVEREPVSVWFYPVVYQPASYTPPWSSIKVEVDYSSWTNVGSDHVVQSGRRLKDIASPNNYLYVSDYNGDPDPDGDCIYTHDPNVEIPYIGELANVYNEDESNVACMFFMRDANGMVLFGRQAIYTNYTETAITVLETNSYRVATTADIQSTNGLASTTWVNSKKWDWSEVTNKPSISAANHTHESITSSNGRWDLLQMGDGRAVIKPAYYSVTAGGLTIKMFTALPMEDIYNHSSNATIRTSASADFFLGNDLGVHADGYILSNTDFVITNKVTYNSHVVIQDSMEISFASGVGYPESFVLGGGAEIPAPLAKTLVTTDYIKSKVQNVNVNLQSAEDTRVALTNLITILKNL